MLTQLLTMTTTHKFPSLEGEGGAGGEKVSWDVAHVLAPLNKEKLGQCLLVEKGEGLKVSSMKNDVDSQCWRKEQSIFICI